MKLRMIIMAAVLVVPINLMGQNSPPTSSAALPQRAATQNVVSVSGTVLADGRSIVSEQDGGTWKVTNPETLKSLSGHRASVRCHVTGENTIEVISTKAIKAETRYAVNLGDAAFRR